MDLLESVGTVDFEDVFGTPVRVLMKQAYQEAQKSTDPSTQNGAVLVHPRGWSGTGHNRLPLSIPAKVAANYLSDRSEKYPRVIHAEMNAIFDAFIAATRQHAPRLPSHFPLAGSTVVCPWAACTGCMKHMQEVGVSRLIVDGRRFNRESWGMEIAFALEMANDTNLKVYQYVPEEPFGLAVLVDGKLETF